MGYFMPLLDSGQMTGNKGERVATKVPSRIGATNIVHTQHPSPEATGVLPIKRKSSGFESSTGEF